MAIERLGRPLAIITGVTNPDLVLFKEIGVTEQRQEILDWYHLKENLYKAGGSLKRSKQAESLLWSGQVEQVRNLFKGLKRKAFQTFGTYLDTHRKRIVNYQYYQE